MNKKIISVIILLFVAICTITYFLYHNPVEKKDYNENHQVTFLLKNDEVVSFYCEIADDIDEQEKGLMFRESLASNSGMLFINEESKYVCYWMKDCLIPLDIIFIDENLTVVNIKEAIVQQNVSDNDLIRYCSDKPVLYIVEINYGLSKNLGIESGVNIKLVNI